MDNRLNEIRRKIRSLRLEMLDLARAIRAQMGRDEDCRNDAWKLMAMRREMLALIDRRNAMGGREESPGARRFKQEPRSLHRSNAPPACLGTPLETAGLENSFAARDEKHHPVSIFRQS